MATRIPINKDINQFDDRQKHIWADMEHDMERRRREWEGEIDKLRSDFFHLRPEKTVHSFDSLDGPANPMAPRLAAQPVHHGLEPDDGKGILEKDEKGNPVFKVRFNMKDYRPEEVNVKMDDKKIMVSARHEEKGGGSTVSREYSREVNIPTDVDPLSLQCIFQPDGYLVFNAPLPVPKYSTIKESSSGPTHSPPPKVIKTSFQSSSASSNHGGNGSAPIHHITTFPVHSTPSHHHHNHHHESPHHHSSTSTPPAFSKTSASPFTSSSTSSSHSNNTSMDASDIDHIVPSFKPPPDFSKLDSLLLDTSSHNHPMSSSGQSSHSPRLLHHTTPGAHGASSPLPKPPPFSTLSSTFPSGPIFPESAHQAQLSNPVVTSHDGKFQLTMPIDEFKPEELTVKTQDRKVVICAKRQITTGNRNHTMEMNREHSLPDNVDPLTIKAFFTDTNNLIVEAPFIHS